jgi:hypothetical protein
MIHGRTEPAAADYALHRGESRPQLGLEESKGGS